jgi:hypothetical protein
VSGPVFLAKVHEDVGRRQEHVVFDRSNRRQNSTVPEFPDVTLIASRHVALELLPCDQLSQQATFAFEFLDSKLPRSVPAGLAYVDYDNDGWMDLCVVNNSQKNMLYHNEVLFHLPEC